VLYYPNDGDKQMKDQKMIDDQIKHDVLQAFGQAWANADVDALMSMMTEDCIYAASVGDEPGTTYRGKDEVRRGFAEILAYESGGESRSGRVWVSGNFAFAEWSYDEVDNESNVLEIRGIDIFEFVGNKLRLKDAYRKTKY